MSDQPGTPETRHAGQVAYWSGPGGDSWLQREARIDASIALLGQRALTAAAAKPHERVLDIGCGTGPTTRALARAVAPHGSVLGLDLSAPMTAEAARRVSAEGLDNVRFVVGDASTHPLPPSSFDLMFSRFGVMFFGDPPAAFAHLRHALKPAGRLCFLCWRPFKENLWAWVPFMAAAPFLPPLPRPGPDEPGPFAFGDPERVRRILSAAGFSAIAIEPVDEAIPLSDNGGLEDAVSQALLLGPLARALADAAPDIHEKAVEAVRAALAPLMTGGTIHLPAACWLVRASNPG
jgi:SAM-dependent methyltransferase